MNTLTCSLKSINLLVSYPHKNKMKSPCFRQKPTFQLSNHWDSGDDALSFSSKFRVPKGQHFRPAGKRLVKVVDVNLFDPEETLKGSSKRGNKWCLRGGSIHCCMNIWHRVKKMLIPTPHRGSAYGGHSSFTLLWLAWGSSGMFIKINLFHPLLARVKTIWGYSDTGGTLLSLSFFFSFFVFLGPHPRDREVPRLGVESELQLPATATATAKPDPSCICDLHHSSWQPGSLTHWANPSPHGY